MIRERSANTADKVKACPANVSVQIGRGFAGHGDADALARLYHRASLVALLGHVILATVALLLSTLSAAVLLLVPPDRAGLVAWVAAPAGIAALGLGGFAVFKLSLGPDGVALYGEANNRHSASRKIEETVD